MFETNAYNLQQALEVNYYSQADRAAQASRKALQAFYNALKQGWWEKLWASLSNRHYAGIKTVRINQIRGSEGRTEDFNAKFKPLQVRSKGRWISIAKAQLTDQALPLVELIQIGETYYVRDGHHRISVAQALGQESIEAEVTVM